MTFLKLSGEKMAKTYNAFFINSDIAVRLVRWFELLILAELNAMSTYYSYN